MTEKIAVVTGANRGLGLATAQALAERSFRVLMLGRNEERIREAAEPLREKDLDVETHVVDVTSDDAVDAFARELEDRVDHLDVLVNNAGAFFESRDPAEPSAFSALQVRPEVVMKTLDVNALGALRMSQALAPLLCRSSEGRVVNVSSGLGALEDMGGSWPGYRISKTALNAVTRTLAAELESAGVKVNSICPGWVRTEMGGPGADRSIEEGVRGILWAATLDDDGPTGGFFRDGERIPW
jgi:NAD(P)-dependent dehydrogenase (short-subunit alcohol dehydrogenase family)